MKICTKKAEEQVVATPEISGIVNQLGARIDDSTGLYKQVSADYPQIADVVDSICDLSLQQRGQIEALKKSLLTPDEIDEVMSGEEKAQAILNGDVEVTPEDKEEAIAALIDAPIVCIDCATEGLSGDMTIEDIAKKHGVDADIIRAQVDIGKKVEKEHTDSEAEAERIALDHLFEMPDYYDRLAKMEKGAAVNFSSDFSNRDTSYKPDETFEQKMDRINAKRNYRYNDQYDTFISHLLLDIGDPGDEALKEFAELLLSINKSEFNQRILDDMGLSDRKDAKFSTVSGITFVILPDTGDSGLDILADDEASDKMKFIRLIEENPKIKKFLVDEG